MELLESQIQVHECAVAYRKGIGIRDNSLAHIQSNYLLKLDLENFFNSISPRILFKSIDRQNVIISENDKAIIEQIAFWNRSRRKNGRLVLSVGAPSSPLISNISLFFFDERVKKYVKDKMYLTQDMPMT